MGQAVKEGAAHIPLKIEGIEYKNDKPILFSQGGEIGQADLVVGAVGVNSAKSGIFRDIGFGYEEPRTIKAALAELSFDRNNFV